MNGDPGRHDRPGLEDLVHRARSEVREWTDGSDRDPGVALLELFALVGDVLSDYSERVAAEVYLGSRRRRSTSDLTVTVGHRRGDEYRSVVLQQGRVPLDPDTPDEAPGPVWGVHPAVVVEDTDPLGQSRVQVRVPAVAGERALWAAACLPGSAAGEVPVTGSAVWVAFEAGDPSRPVWLGRRVAP